MAARSCFQSRTTIPRPSPLRTFACPGQSDDPIPSRSQGAGTALSVVPTVLDRSPSLMRRLRLPLPLSLHTCRCGRPIDSFGHHCAACARAGVLGRRGVRTRERRCSHLPRGGWSCWDELHDGRLGSSSPCRRQSPLGGCGGRVAPLGGCQLAVDTTLVCAMHCDGKVQVHQNHFRKKKFSSKSTFIKNRFHQEPLSSKTTFIKKPLSSKNHFHQKTTFIKKPLSSKNHFHQQTTFIRNHFYQKPFLSETIFIRNHFHQKPLSSETTSCQIVWLHGLQKGGWVLKDAGQKAGGENGEVWRKMTRKGGTVNIVQRRLHTNTAYARLSGFNRPSCGGSPAEGRRCST